jgi:heptosyltransferase I
MTPPQSICILRFSAIGDVCHAVAVVQAIQRHDPTAKITWVIGKVEAMLVGDIKNVEFIVFDKKTGLKGYLDLRKQLRGRHFDVLLHMQVALRASLASLCIKATQRWGFDKARAKEGQWLFTNHKIKAQQQPHVLDGFMAFAEAIGVPVAPPSWDIPLSTQDNLWAHSQLSHTKKNFIISPAASKAERNWTTQGYAEIADYANSHGYQVSLCGGVTATEKQLAADIAALTSAPVNNLVGQTSLKQLLAILKHADLVLAPDTGPAHMSTTVGTPVIGLYAHSNPGRTGPYNNQDSVVEVYNKYMPDAVWGQRAKGPLLMQDIRIDDVKQAMQFWFDKQEPSA